MSVTRKQLSELHKQNPTWDMQKLADELGCRRQYVSTTAARYGLDIPRGPNSREAKNHKVSKWADRRDRYKHALEFIAQGCGDPASIARIALEGDNT